jgi:hypothetical protein
MHSFASDDPYIDPSELALANARHDAEPHTVPMEHRIRFKTMRMGDNLVGELLTDKKIGHYAKKGYYSPEYRQARKDLQAKKKARRTGNFDEIDGRMIYRPT